MTKNLLALIVVFSTFSLSGCNPQGSNQSGDHNAGSVPIPDPGEVIATVNGEPITETTLTMVAEANRRANLPREKIIDDLIKHELLYQEAVRKDLAKNADVAQRLELARRSILSQAAMQDFLMNNPVTDTQIEDEYKTSFGSSGQEEYKARHILLKTEDEAKKVIQKLNEGGDFAALAKEFSTGPTGTKGGDLGWFAAQQMVAPFSQAVAALKNGEYSKEPVQTQFGWHVILREDSRAKTPPPMDSIKPTIQAQLQRKSIDDHLESLKQAAKIEITPEKTVQEESAAASTSTESSDTAPSTAAPSEEQTPQATKPKSEEETSTPQAKTSQEAK